MSFRERAFQKRSLLRQFSVGNNNELSTTNWRNLSETNTGAIKAGIFFYTTGIPNTDGMNQQSACEWGVDCMHP